MITYPVDVANTKWSVIQISTGEIVGRNYTWPRPDGGEIQGADPDYVYLLQSSTAQPDYDARLYTLQGTEVVDIPANEINKTWATVKRPINERIQAAENVEAERLGDHIDLAREIVMTRLVLGAIIHYTVDNQDFPPKARIMINEYKAKAVKLWQNRDRLDEIITELEADIDSDLDALWSDAT